MHQDASSRRPSWFARLFAERQVYVRSGSEGHYVLLTRPLQLAVGAAVLLAVVWLAAASYGALTGRLTIAQQEAELGELRRVQAVQEDALAVAEDAGAQAERQAQAALAEARALRRELALAEQGVSEAAERIAKLEAARDALAGWTTLRAATVAEAEPGTPAAADDADPLAEEIAAAKAEVAAMPAAEEAVAALEAELATAEETLLRMAEERGGSDELTHRLIQATARIDALETALQRFKAEPADPAPPPAPAKPR